MDDEGIFRNVKIIEGAMPPSFCIRNSFNLSKGNRMGNMKNLWEDTRLERHMADLEAHIYKMQTRPRVQLLKSAPGVYEDVRKDWRVTRVDGGYPKSHCWVAADKETGESFEFVSLSEAKDYISEEMSHRYVSDNVSF